MQNLFQLHYTNSFMVLFLCTVLIFFWNWKPVATAIEANANKALLRHIPWQSISRIQGIGSQFLKQYLVFVHQVHSHTRCTLLTCWPSCRSSLNVAQLQFNAVVTTWARRVDLHASSKFRLCSCKTHQPLLCLAPRTFLLPASYTTPYQRDTFVDWKR